MNSYKGYIPVSIVDKNGRRTTVHRRPEAQDKQVTKLPAPALSNIAQASAALMLMTMQIPGEEGDRRAFLVREVVNTGMDDDDAVEFLSLTVMPMEMLESVSEYIRYDGDKKQAAKHRQGFFRMANDAFHDLPPEDACIAVNNAMKIMDRGLPFNDSTVHQLDELKTVGIDWRRPLNDSELDKASKYVFLVNVSDLLSKDEADRYFGKTQLDESETKERTYVKDETLAEIILNSGDRFDAMVNLILERDSCDPSLLVDLMETPAPSVSEGLL